MRLPPPLPLASPLAALLVMMSGCFTPEATPLAVDLLSFSNDYTAYPDIVLEPFYYPGLDCPDGEPAVFYAVYRESPPGPAPVVLLFHSGSFDYVIAPDAEDPLGGPHYREDDDRLNAAWASSKVFETLGLLDSTDGEENAGTLPAALANAGAFTIYPANCWGDLWHNETGYEPNSTSDYFARNGRALSWAVTALFSPDEATRTGWREALNFEPPIELDDASIAMVGLGEGGRAIPELLRRSQFVNSVAGNSSALPPIRGTILDSTMDNLYPVWIDDTTFGQFNAGLDLIYPDQADSDIGKYSMQRWVTERGVPGSIQVVWSSADPQVPVTTLQGIVGLADGTTILQTDTGQTGHIFLNADLAAAADAVDRMLGL